MRSPTAGRRRAAGVLTILLAAGFAVPVQIATLGQAAAHRSHPAASAARTSHHRAHGSRRPHAAKSSKTARTARSTTTTTTTTTPPPAPTTPTTNSPPPTPPMPPPPASGAVPPRGAATAWGCPAAEAYLKAYANPAFTVECPGNAQGREGMTCANELGACPNEAIIAIADACPAAYMNEASNSWSLLGLSSAPIDPYGSC